MIEKKDTEHLAKLSRIELKEDDIKGLTKDIENILGYVDQIKEANIEGSKTEAGVLRNVLREDEEPHESGIHTEKILKEAPDREGDFIKVKNIL